MKKPQVLVASTAAMFLIVFACGAAFSLIGRAKQPRRGVVPLGENVTAEKAMAGTPLARQEYISILFCGLDQTNWLTDVVAYGVLNTETNTAAVLQIPRDSFVGEVYPTGKINAVYGNPSQSGEGIGEIKKVLQNQLGLSVDYFVTLTLDGFRNIVDAFGGVEIEVPQKMEYLPGKVLYPGRQVLSGQQAEWFVRYRSGYATGDIGRIGAQQNFLEACFAAAKNKGIGTCLSVLLQNYGQIETDMPLSEMLRIARAVFAMESGDIRVFLAPGTGAMYRSHAVYQWDRKAMAALLNQHFRPSGQVKTEKELSIAAVEQHKKKPAAGPQLVGQKAVEPIQGRDCRSLFFTAAITEKNRFWPPDRAKPAP